MIHIRVRYYVKLDHTFQFSLLEKFCSYMIYSYYFVKYESIIKFFKILFNVWIVFSLYFQSMLWIKYLFSWRFWKILV